MSCFLFAPIVEGKGEVEAVPKLLRRIFENSKARGRLEVNPPLRIKSGSFIRDASCFQRYIELASRHVKSRGSGCVLILLDCEDDCPGKLGPDLLKRAQQVRSDVPFLVSLAYREYETWFLASARSLRSIAGLPCDLEPPPQPDQIRGAKEWLSQHLPHGYDEVEHQLLFTEKFSFAEAIANKSFARLKTKIQALFVLARILS